RAFGLGTPRTTSRTAVDPDQRAPRDRGVTCETQAAKVCEIMLDVLTNAQLGTKMQFADILICMDGTPTGRQRTELGLNLAMRPRARVIGYYLTQRRPPTLRDSFDEPEARVIENAFADFERELRQRGLEGTWVVASESRIAEDAVNYARCVDLVIAGL